MKRYKILLFCLLFIFVIEKVSGQGVGIGTPAPNSSAKLEISATDKGLLPTRMTTVQRDAIIAPAEGLTIYNITLNCLEFYNGTKWIGGINCGCNSIGGKISTITNTCIGTQLTLNNYNGNILQWQQSTDNIWFRTIPGATSNTYSTNIAGYYRVVVCDRLCEPVVSDTVQVIPVTLCPVNFTGPTLVCANQTSQYLYAPVSCAVAVGYEWTVTGGLSIISGQNTNTVSVQSGSTSGNVCLTITTETCVKPPVCKAVALATGPPSQPGVISGKSSICYLDTPAFSIASLPSASFYTWSIPISGSPGDSIVSGQGNSTIRAKLGNVTGNVCVTAGNGCGSSAPTCLTLTNTNAVPGIAPSISGSTSFCSGTPLSYGITPIADATSYLWEVPAGGIITAGQGTSGIAVDNNILCGGTVCVTAVNSCGNGIKRCKNISPGQWTSKANFIGVRTEAIGFTIGNKAYVGTGFGNDPVVSVSNQDHNDLWEFDPANGVNGTWTQMAVLPGSPRKSAFAFSTTTKGYVGGGCETLPQGQQNCFLIDFYEYDPVTNAWRVRANLPGLPRKYGYGIAIGDKGYYGFGRDATDANLNDFWEYDPITDIWTAKANYGGAGRLKPAGFVIAGKAYIGTGLGAVKYNDFWVFDPASGISGTWTRKADFPGVARHLAIGFAINNWGYMGTGAGNSTRLKDMYKYDPGIDSWCFVTTYPADAYVYDAVGLTIGDKGYLGTGVENNQITNRWMEFCP